MTTTSSRKIFVNLPVQNLDRAMAFFRALGFGFNPQFTNEQAACMIVSDEAFVMLLTEPRFKDFTRKQICDTRTGVEGIFALSCTSRAEVDQMVQQALASGGSAAMDTMDYGFMYGRSFFDPDGHHWEVIWMDPAHVQ